MSTAGTEAIEIRTLHTRRDHAESTPNPLRRFSGGRSPLPPDFVQKVLEADVGYSKHLA